MEIIARVGERNLTIRDLDLVSALDQALSQRLGEQRYNLWFANKTKFIWQDPLLVIGVPNHFYQEWLDKTFRDDLLATVQTLTDVRPEIRFTIDPELFQAARRQEAQHRTLPARAEQPSRLHHKTDGEPVRPALLPAPGTARPSRKPMRRWLKLEDFVVGPCNRVAHASAVSAVEAPLDSPSPLVLYGPVGTGKSHLLQGICAGLRSAHPSWRVCLVTAEEFTNRFVQAMRLGKLGAFRKQYREVDSLLFDDLPFLAGKPKTQEEFLHTLDVLICEGRQMVLTCDVHPRLDDTLMPELTDRLLGGVVWSVGLPEEETRRQILRQKATLLSGGTPLGEEVIAFLAGQLRGNVRELEGSLHALTHFSRVVQRPIDVSLAREALGDYLRQAVRLVSLADVERVLCAVLGLESRALQSDRRDWRHSHPRMLAMYLARKHTGATYAEIGQRFGGRNHSTVMAAEKKVRHWLQKQETIQLGGRQIVVRDVLERVEQELGR